MPITLAWTDWRPFSRSGAPALPREPGLYRIRAVGDSRLAYIGQTGRSLHERVGSLRAIFRDEMPYRDPHTVGPALWAWLQTEELELEVSVQPVPGEAPWRKALEAVAIAQHRQAHGVSPRWNFGRMPRGYRMSSANNARLAAAGRRFRGGPCDEILPSHKDGVAPRGPLGADVQSPAWCGHRWSSWLPLDSGGLPSVPQATGLYRLRGRGDQLVYVGEGAVRARLVTHAKKLGAATPQGRALTDAAPLTFSFTADPTWQPHQRLELETDLIAAHVLAFDCPPAAQFIG